MSYSLSSVAVFPLGNNVVLASGLNSIVYPTNEITADFTLSGTVSKFTDLPFPDQLVSAIAGLDIKDSVFIKRIRLNSKYRVFESAVFGPDAEELFSYIGIGNGARGLDWLSIYSGGVRFYEWRDVNLVLPPNGANFIRIKFPELKVYYNLPSAYKTADPLINDRPYFEIEFAHSYPLATV